jgi:glycosyltransferase involved in cell wall biosynthesis
MVFEVRDLWPAVPIELGWLRHPALRWSAHALERWIYRNSAAVIALSPGMASGVEKSGYPPERVVVAPNCADNDLFHSAMDGGRFQKPDAGDALRAIYVGTLGRANRVSILLQVARILEQRRINVHFTVLGDGYERRSMEEGIRKWDLSSIRMGGAVPKRSVPDWMAAADIGLVLFDDFQILGTNSPNKFFDYCAAGRASLINTNGWLADLVENERIGVAVRDGKPESIAAALEALAADRTACRDMGRRARRVAETHFDRDVVSRRVLDTLIDVRRRWEFERGD